MTYGGTKQYQGSGLGPGTVTCTTLKFSKFSTYDKLGKTKNAFHGVIGGFNIAICKEYLARYMKRHVICSTLEIVTWHEKLRKGAFVSTNLPYVL